MTPPLPQVRSRSIARWMQDCRPEEFRSLTANGHLQQRVQQIDEQMMEAFGALESRLMEQLMAEKAWGTEEGLGRFQTDRLTLWSEVVNEFLEPTTIQDSVG